MVSIKHKSKNTEKLPSGWQELSVGETLRFKNGLNKAKEYFGYGTPIVNYMDVYQHSGLRSADVKGKVSVTRDEINNYSARKGDVLFTRTSETAEEVGMASVLLEDIPSAVFSGFVLRGRPQNDVLDRAFCQYCFGAPDVRKQIVSRSSYTTRALTSGGSLSKVFVRIPKSLGEQRAIATILSDTDGLIRRMEVLLAKKQDAKRATMQQLLTGKSRLPGFKKTWETKKIIEFTNCTSGGTPNTSVSEYWGGSIKWMNSGELNDKVIYDVEGRITEAGLRGSSTKLVPANSVLVGLAGQGKTRGTGAISRVPLCTNQSIAAILPSNDFVPEYLYYNLDYRYEELRGLSTGGEGRGGLNLSIIKSLPVPFPEKKEQEAITTVLYDMDAEIAQLNNTLEKYKVIKVGMMQQLLTGKIRIYGNHK